MYQKVEGSCQRVLSNGWRAEPAAPYPDSYLMELPSFHGYGRRDAGGKRFRLWSGGSGYKPSGWGREMGHDALELYTEVKAVTVRL